MRRTARRPCTASTGPDRPVLAPRWDPARRSAQGDAAASAVTYAPGAPGGQAVS
ncbi:hypothetical protein ACFV3E_27450 [Streptomyces sp. NPDC059718]